MLKFQNLAEIGATIRSYDFKPMRGRGDSYIEGEVMARIDDGVDEYLSIPSVINYA